MLFYKYLHCYDAAGIQPCRFLGKACKIIYATKKKIVEYNRNTITRLLDDLNRTFAI